MLKRFLQAENFLFGQSAAIAVCLQQGHFSATRGLAGGVEADRRSDAADAVQVSIGFRYVLDCAIVAAGHAVRRGDRVFDFALERGCEAMPYSGKADFELISVHGNLLLLICSQHSRQELIAGHVSKLI
jgi:hypothetical protein